MKRIFLIVLDSFGIGAMPDAPAFGDINVNTLATVSQSPRFSTPNLQIPPSDTGRLQASLPKPRFPSTHTAFPKKSSLPFRKRPDEAYSATRPTPVRKSSRTLEKNT